MSAPAERGADEPTRAVDAALWLALLAPPVALLANQVAVYGLVPKACANGWRLPLQLIPVLLLAVSLAAGVVAWRSWRALGPEWPGADARRTTRARFMAVVALMGCALFSTIIVWQWIATFMLEPCQ